MAVALGSGRSGRDVARILGALGNGAGPGSGSGTYTPVTDVRRVQITTGNIDGAVSALSAPAPVVLGNNCLTTDHDRAKFLRHLAAKAVLDVMAGAGHGKTLNELRRGHQIQMTAAQLERAKSEARKNSTIRGAMVSSGAGNRYVVYVNGNPNIQQGVVCAQINGVTVGK